jgi:hypothetical protein
MGARWTAERTTATRKTACAHNWLGRTRAKNTQHFPLGDKVPAPIKDPPYVPPAVLPKTDNMRLKELKQMLIEGKGQQVVQKVLDIALEDGHPGQMAALKLCMERALPVSMFEKTAAQRAAVTINITGIGGPDAPAPQAEIIDVQMKDANG